MTAKMTLLEIVQSVLNDLDSDNVNSVSDTEEAQQVASIAKDVYYQFVHEDLIPEHFNVATLTALGDTTRPNYMRMPTSLTHMEWVKYNVRESGDTEDTWRELRYIPPQDMVTLLLENDSSDTNVQDVTDPNGVTLPVINDEAPLYWSTFDDDYIIFNSFDVGVDATLQASKTIVYGSFEPTFDKADGTMTPDMDASMFPQYLAEVKSTAFVHLLQMNNPKAEQHARRTRVKSQNKRQARSKAQTNQLNARGRNNYGRK